MIDFAWIRSKRRVSLNVAMVLSHIEHVSGDKLLTKRGAQYLLGQSTPLASHKALVLAVADGVVAKRLVNGKAVFYLTNDARKALGMKINGHRGIGRTETERDSEQW